MDDKTRIELEAAVYRRLVEHLRGAHRCAEYRSDELGRLLPQLPVKLDEGSSRCQKPADEHLRADRRRRFTSNEGFSVVAPMNVSRPCSTNGRNASCCALLKRCTSSTNMMVARPDCARVSSARATASRMSLTPASTAEMRDELGVECVCHQARERRLAHARRAPQDHRMQPAGVNATRSGLPGAQQVPLSDHLVDRARPQPLGERRAGGRRRGEEIGHDELEDTMAFGWPPPA